MSDKPHPFAAAMDELRAVFEPLVDELVSEAEERRRQRELAAAPAADYGYPERTRMSHARLGLGLLPSFAQADMKDVPGSYWRVKDGVAAVSCPCGERPEVEIGQLARCACDRWFFFTGRSVRSAQYGGPFEPDEE